MGLEWLLISVLIITGWGGFLGWSMEHIEKACLTRNTHITNESREGPLERCTKDTDDH